MGVRMHSSAADTCKTKQQADLLGLCNHYKAQAAGDAQQVIVTHIQLDWAESAQQKLAVCHLLPVLADKTRASARCIVQDQRQTKAQQDDTR